MPATCYLAGTDTSDRSMTTSSPFWLDQLIADAHQGVKRLGVLLDPQDAPSGAERIELLARIARSAATDVLVGGSLVTDGDTEQLVRDAKDLLAQPVVLFPGSPSQVSPGADALLFLSLISGRNADLLIGRHVEAAPRVAALRLHTVPTGYMLLGDPPLTAAAYISHSLPIPLGKPDLAVATAQAGVMLGLRCLYLDAGSGANVKIPAATVQAISRTVDVPIIVGGGMTCQEDLEEIWEAGATLAVVGSAIERDLSVLDTLYPIHAFKR
jgi:geranylgeranylglyceryl phosphate synthase family protein